MTAGRRCARPGPTARGDHDIAAWERILAEYAALQRSVEGEATRDEMLAAGVPDGRPSRLPGELARLLDDDVAWSRITDDERAAADGRPRAAPRQRSPRSTPPSSELDAAGIPPSIQHDDLHGGNILVGPDGDRFFDWGDAVVAHPFSTLTTTFNSIAHHTGRPARRSGLRAPARRLHGGLDRSSCRAPTWRAPSRSHAPSAASPSRSPGNATSPGSKPDEMDGNGDAVAGWLMEFDDAVRPPLTR